MKDSAVDSNSICGLLWRSTGVRLSHSYLPFMDPSCIYLTSLLYFSSNPFVAAFSIRFPLPLIYLPLPSHSHYSSTTLSTILPYPYKSFLRLFKPCLSILIKSTSTTHPLRLTHLCPLPVGCLIRPLQHNTAFHTPSHLDHLLTQRRPSQRQIEVLPSNLGLPQEKVTFRTLQGFIMSLMSNLRDCLW